MRPPCSRCLSVNRGHRLAGSEARRMGLSLPVKRDALIAKAAACEALIDIYDIILKYLNIIAQSSCHGSHKASGSMARGLGFPAAAWRFAVGQRCKSVSADAVQLCGFPDSGASAPRPMLRRIDRKPASG